MPSLAFMGRAAGVVASALLWLAGPAGAASPTLYTAGWNAWPRVTPLFQQPEPANFLTAPGGAVTIGGYLWYGEEYWGGRLDPDPAGLMLPQPHRDYGYFFSTNANKVGQMAIDRTRSVFYWTNPQKANGLGVAANFYDAASSTIHRTCWFAWGYASYEPTAAAVGPDGQLYVGFRGLGDVVRFDTRDLAAQCPAAPASIALGATGVGSSMRGNALSGLAFVGPDLYLSGKDGLGVIRNAAACTGGCRAVDVAGSASRANHVGLASDGVDRVYYLRDNAVWRYRVAANLHELIASGGTLPDGRSAAFAFINGQTNLLALDDSDTLWIGDDINNGLTTYSGRIWRLAQASAAAGTPVQPPAPAATTLAVKTAGGKGFVTGSPGGIACGAVCQASLPPGTAVTLSVQADPGFRFVGWTGACIGSASSCSFTLASGKNEVQANFTK